MRPQGDTVESAIARIAGRQHGVVTHRQLRAAGVSAGQIKRRVAKGLLLPVHRGAYRVGHRAPSSEARYMAAVLACGEGAALAGRAAAHLLGLTRQPPSLPEVAAPHARAVPGVKLRRVPRIDPREVSELKGIPVTTVPRTLVDLAAILSADELMRACHEAEVRYRTKPEQVTAILARRPNAPGAVQLRRVLSGDEKVTLSHLERAFLSLLKRNGLPLPETNRVAGAHRVDCRWPDHKLTVELDSYRYHNSRHAWEQSYQREREARRRDDEWKRFTLTDVEEERYAVAEVRRLLAR